MLVARNQTKIPQVKEGADNDKAKKSYECSWNFKPGTVPLADPQIFLHVQNLPTWNFQLLEFTYVQLLVG